MYAFLCFNAGYKSELRTFGGSGDRFSRCVNLNLVAYLDLRPPNRSARQFQNTPQLHADRGKSKRRQAVPQLKDLEVPIETYHIDLEGHSKSMDAGRGFDPQPSSGVQTTSTEQANHPLQGRVRQLDTLSNSSAPGCIGYSEHKKSISATGPQLGRLLLSAEDDNSQYGGC
jgi:hypothetical protein